MAVFIGTAASDQADAPNGVLIGLTGGTIVELQDATGDSFDAGASDDVIAAGAGNDLVYAGDGIDNIDGGDGDDVLRGGAGADVIVGGAGVDTIDFDDAFAIFVNLGLGIGASNQADGDSYSGIENVFGGIYNDVLLGNDGVNRLEGRNGDDILIGGLGADVLIGGNGVDTASYADNQGPVQVSLAGNYGLGNAAQGDQFSGIENLAGTAFSDVLIGDGNPNRLDGGDGDDTLQPGLHNDIIIGGAGQDAVSYADSAVAVVVNLTSGNHSGGAVGDFLSGIENLIGSAFADALTGDAAFEGNVIDGGDGADLIAPLIGNDIIDGGAGEDTIEYRGLQGITVNLILATATPLPGHIQTIHNVENIRGSEGSDTLIGTDGNNRIEGGDGNDLLIGAMGADVLFGGDAADGTDTVSYAMDYGAVFINLTSRRGYGNDAEGDTYVRVDDIIGSSFNDVLIGSADPNSLWGGGGDDILIGGRGGDILDGGAGNDTVSYADNSSTANASLETNEAVAGGHFDTFVSIENLTGSHGPDTLTGNGADNRIDGGVGADVLNGRYGLDTLIGGLGVDTFVFDTAFTSLNLDTILDWETSDRIHLSGALTGLAAGTLPASAFASGSTATDAAHRILYDSATGAIYFDSDGTGANAPIHFMSVTPGSLVNGTGFVIV